MNNKSSMRQWFKSGDPWIWMIGGGLAISLIMVVGLLLLIAVLLFVFFPVAAQNNPALQAAR